MKILKEYDYKGYDIEYPKHGGAYGVTVAKGGRVVREFADEHDAEEWIDEETEENESLTEDTVKTSDGKWTNKGDEGTHGKFKTKKAADKQRKAMFANGYKAESKETDKLYKAVSDTVDAIDDLGKKDEKSAKKNLDRADDNITDVKDTLKEYLEQTLYGITCKSTARGYTDLLKIGRKTVAFTNEEQASKCSSILNDECGPVNRFVYYGVTKFSNSDYNNNLVVFDSYEEYKKYSDNAIATERNEEKLRKDKFLSIGNNIANQLKKELIDAGLNIVDDKHKTYKDVSIEVHSYSSSAEIIIRAGVSIRGWSYGNITLEVDEDEMIHADNFSCYISKEPFEECKQYIVKQVKKLCEKSIKESLTEELNPEEVGISSVFNDLIQKEYDLLSQYDSAQITLEDNGDSRFSDIFEYIKDDINIHIGMLQSCLEDLNDSEDLQAEGEQKADELLSLDESLFESV